MGKIFRKISWLLAELLIVIVGVYVAFLLNEWRANRSLLDSKRQLYSALQEEVQDVDANVEELLASYGKSYSDFKKSYKNGNQPSLEPVYFSIEFTPYLFKASTNGVGNEQLNVPLMYDLSEFYNSLDWALAQLKQLESYSKDQLVPALDSRNVKFYDERNQLKASWQWYIKYNDRLLKLLNRLDTQADSLEEKLAASVNETQKN